MIFDWTDGVGGRLYTSGAMFWGASAAAAADTPATGGPLVGVGVGVGITQG